MAHTHPNPRSKKTIHIKLVSTWTSRHTTSARAGHEIASGRYKILRDIARVYALLIDSIGGQSRVYVHSCKFK